TNKAYILQKFVQNKQDNMLGGIIMLQENNEQTSPGMPAQQNFGGNELFDIDEAIGTFVNALEHQVLYEQYVQDEKLITIMNRQKAFLTTLYDTILDTLQSGTDPAKKTETYLMQEGNQTIYGLKPSSPK